MLGFRFACARHQAVFFDYVQRAGCRNVELMERIRQRLYAWLAKTYGEIVSESMKGARCIACDLEAAQADLSAVRRGTLEITLQALNEASWHEQRKDGKI